MDWESRLLSFISQVDNEINLATKNPRFPQRGNDFSKAIQQAHPNWVLDDKRAVRIGVIGVGKSEYLQKLSNSIYRSCQNYPALVKFPLGLPALVSLPLNPQAVLSGLVDETVVRTKREGNLDLVILATDGSYGWPRTNINRTVIAVLGTANPPLYLLHRVLSFSKITELAKTLF